MFFIWWGKPFLVPCSCTLTWQAGKVCSFVCVRRPTRTCLLQVRLLADAELRSPSGESIALKCPSSITQWTQIVKELLSQTFPAATAWAALVANPPYSFQLKHCLCLCAPMLAEQGVKAQVTKGELAAWALQTSTHPRETWLGWHNRNSVIPALMQSVNQLTESTQPKGFQRLFKAILGSSEQVTSGTSLSFTQKHKVSTSLQDLPAEGLEEAHGRRNSHWPGESKQLGKKTQASCDFWPPGSLPSVFVFEGQCPLAKSVLEMYQ